MIPISVSDILKILDDIPVWRNVAALPRKIAALEQRVAALEAAKTALPAPTLIDPAKACPMDGTEMQITAEVPHAIFGVVGGLKVHQMTCPECGFKTSRDFAPGKGYQASAF